MERNPMSRMRRFLVAGATALVLAGCGDTPLEPVAGSGGNVPASPELLTVGADGSVGYVTAPTATTSDAQPAGIPAGSQQPSEGVTASREVRGATGGTVTCGRFTVTLPRNAYRGTGTITMRVDDPTRMIVDLEITPGSLNSFRTPVALSFDATGLDLQNPVTIYYYDPARNRWVDMAAQVDPSTGRPTVYLSHFSKYAAGKVGW